MSGRPILLDTHAALWMTEAGELDGSAEEELERAAVGGVPIFVSPISAWEVGLLVARGRIVLPMSPSNWFDALVGSGLQWSALSPQILIESSFLPAGVSGDPADRILVATARAFNYRLMTRDGILLAYARAGHLSAIPC